MSKLKVAAAQIGVTLGDLAANLDTHRDLCRQAHSQGVELLLFPELSLTGYQLGSNMPAVAMYRDSPLLLALAAECPGIVVVCGFVEEVSPGEYCNAMAWLHRGKVVFVHRKINLPTYGGLEEGKLYTRSQQLELCEVKPDWPAATLICADLWNPGLVHAVMLRRPSLLLAPINSALGVVSEDFSNPDGWALNLRFYAMTYGTPLIMANRCDLELDAKFWGGSRILGPRGEILAQAGEADELICAELELAQIAKARFELPTIRDADTTLIKQLL